MPDNVGIVVKQMRDAGLTGPIVGGDGYDTPDLPAIAGPASNDVFFTTHALMDAVGGTEPIKKFMTAYEAKFGHPVENAFAALGYDTVYLLKPTPSSGPVVHGRPGAQVRHRDDTDFPGITGSITFTPEAHVPQKGVTIIEVKDGASPWQQRWCPSRSRLRDPSSPLEPIARQDETRAAALGPASRRPGARSRSALRGATRALRWEPRASAASPVARAADPRNRPKSRSNEISRWPMIPSGRKIDDGDEDRGDDDAADAVELRGLLDAAQGLRRDRASRSRR